jgi:hypothetical protein
MRRAFIAAAVMFISTWHLSGVGDVLIDWIKLISFFALAFSALGWKADASLLKIARETERMNNEKTACR